MAAIFQGPALTFLEAEGITLVEQHRIEEQSAVLPMGYRGVAGVTIPEEVLGVLVISVEFFESPFICTR